MVAETKLVGEGTPTKRRTRSPRPPLLNNNEKTTDDRPYLDSNRGPCYDDNVTTMLEIDGEVLPPPPSGHYQSRPESSGNDKLVLWVTYINIVLYALCYQLQQPIIPFLVEKLTTDESDAGITYGKLESFFATIQMLGSPLVGILLDRLGIRKASTLVFFASAASYAILAGATDMRLLFYSKIPTALQHAFLVAQATAAASTQGDDVARAHALGRMTTAYTLGATIGPYLGGVLVQEQEDLYVGAKLATVGSLVSVLLSLLFLPDTGNMRQLKPGETPTLRRSRSFLGDLQHSFSLAIHSSLWPLLLAKVIGGVSASMYTTAVPIVLTQQLKYDPPALGFSMSSVMLAVAIFGATGIGGLIHFLSAPGVSRLALACRSVVGLLLSTVVVAGTNPSTLFTIQSQVLFTNVLQGIATHALATSITTQTTGNVDAEEQGALLGLEHGLFSLARIGGPPLGTFLLATSANGFWSVAMACGGIDVGLIALLIASDAWSISPSSSTKSKST